MSLTRAATRSQLLLTRALHSAAAALPRRTVRRALPTHATRLFSSTPSSSSSGAASSDAGAAFATATDADAAAAERPHLDMPELTEEQMKEMMEQLQSMKMDIDSNSAPSEPAAPEADLASKFEAKPVGSVKRSEFQADTRKILNMLAKSIYTDHEVFLRELISNASDALEKLRFLRAQGESGEKDTILTRPLALRIHTNESQNLLVLEDNGIGMTGEEMELNLGVIARSGSKAFMQELESKGVDKADRSNIIGQFGVGFYSVFMVADKVEVLSQSSKLNPETGKPYPAYRWASDGEGSYELSEIESTGETGTSIKIHLKPEFKEFAQSHSIRTVVQKYSNFVGFPLFLNGEKLDTLGAIWLEAKDKVTEEQHTSFYQFLNPGVFDPPTYTLHFHMDAPVAIHGLFYFPSSHMEKYGMGRMEPGASLYSRKVLIKSKSKDLLPEWLRFVKGVADSEDIPLNISRENMQDSRLIQKIGNVLTRRIIKYLEEQAKADPEKYAKWYDEFGNFLKEGVCTEYRLSADIARLLRFESSATKDGEKISLDDYIARMQPDQKGIYYLCANTRAFAQSSPYFERFKEKKIEVLFLYQGIDEFVMSSLGNYNKRKLISIETSGADLEPSEKKEGENKEEAAKSNVDTSELIAYMTSVLSEQVSSISVTSRLVNSPAAIFDHESAAVRRLMKMVDSQGTAAKALPRQKLEINPQHPLIQNILPLRRANPDMARIVVEQLFDNCLIAADMLDTPRSMLERLNRLLDTTAKEAIKNQPPQAEQEKPTAEAEKVKEAETTA